MDSGLVEKMIRERIKAYHHVATKDELNHLLQKVQEEMETDPTTSIYDHIQNVLYEYITV
ncbi:YqzH family protein [Mangrovibacillus cuniculi]|uniref:YqzH-like protein n=1 Tax=Mangrovibacillus cuniculi TaxID=2593652 RepID=A0A7S8HFR1_9BACI|nr:YqzH family protein [Mangrovibacillus cuniculi]QPC46776.1 hypothetical protein G8O30_07265 [Mangrovibacillus cuniculi]